MRVLANCHPSIHRFASMQFSGVKCALLDQVIARAYEHGATHVTASADVKNRKADAFLCHNGFWPVGNNRFFCAPVGTPVLAENLHRPSDSAVAYKNVRTFIKYSPGVSKGGCGLSQPTAPLCLSIDVRTRGLCGMRSRGACCVLPEAN
jgi:hypothetical protein